LVEQKAGCRQHPPRKKRARIPPALPEQPLPLLRCAPDFPVMQSPKPEKRRSAPIFMQSARNLISPDYHSTASSKRFSNGGQTLLKRPEQGR
jgi:hypothetical protein